MKLSLLTTLAVLAATPLWAQEGPPPPMPPESSLPTDFELPDDVVALREELTAAREALRASRQELRESLDGATAEERRAAFEAWREANAESHETVRELADEFHDAIREIYPELPERPEREPVPDDIIEKREQIADQRVALRESRKAVIDGMGEDATAEEIRAALDTWRADNADLIAETEALSEEVGAWFRENRPQRERRPARPGARERGQQFRENAQEFRAARQELRAAIEAAETPEERRELLRQFREENRELMQERKALRRAERLDGVGSGGDRRPGG